MGGQNSTIRSHGTLRGAIVPPSKDVPAALLPAKQAGLVKHRVNIPEGKRPGDTIPVTIAGKLYYVDIPMERERPGGTFIVAIGAEESALNRIIATTLPIVPGMEVVEAKPIVWGSVSFAFTTSSCDQQSMGNLVGKLMQDAQTQVLEQTLAAGCNAVLGLAFNVTNDSSGNGGSQKVVIVTAFGTPCNVIRKSIE